MVSLADIRAAEQRIAGHVIRTPLVWSPSITARTGARVYLKLETLQKAGSFKVRGATNKILANITAAQERGVVAASAGNHAQGVVVAAHAAGVKATIVMPSWASISKQEATRGYGAEVVIYGSSLEESITRAGELAQEGRLFIHPYDDGKVIAGQGGNILHIHHAQGEGDVPVMMARVEIELETRGREHADALRKVIGAAGYFVTTGG